MCWFCAQGPKSPEKKACSKVHRGETQQKRQPRIDQPQDAEHAHLAGVTIQFILKAGRRDNRRRQRRRHPAALRAKSLPRFRCSRPHPLQNIASLPLSRRDTQSTRKWFQIMKRVKKVKSVKTVSRAHPVASTHPTLPFRRPAPSPTAPRGGCRVARMPSRALGVALEGQMHRARACGIAGAEKRVRRLRLQPDDLASGSLLEELVARADRSWPRRARWVRDTARPGCRVARR